MAIIKTPEVLGSKCNRSRSWLFIMHRDDENPIFGWHLDYGGDIYKKLKWYVDKYTDDACTFYVNNKEVSREDAIRINNLRGKTGTLFTIEWEDELYDVDIVDIDSLLVSDDVKSRTHGFWTAKWQNEWIPADRRFVRYPNYVDVTAKTYLKAVLWGLLMGTIGAATMIYVGLAALSSGNDNQHH